MDRVPDYSAAVAGTRAWRLAPNLWARMGGFLWSHVMNDWWIDGEEKVATCEEGHEAPAEGCACGVYAWFSPEHMERNTYMPRDPEHISGVVAGRGGLIRGERRGYWVAERVVVLAFFDDGFPSLVREALPGSGVYLPTKAEAAEAYGVPVIRYAEYEDFCEDYGLIRFG